MVSPKNLEKLAALFPESVNLLKVIALIDEERELAAAQATEAAIAWKDRRRVRPTKAKTAAPAVKRVRTPRKSAASPVVTAPANGGAEKPAA